MRISDERDSLVRKPKLVAQPCGLLTFDKAGENWRGNKLQPRYRRVSPLV